MRRLFLYGSVGVLSLGWLTGCSPFRSPETDSCKCRTGIMQERSTTCQSCTPIQVVQTAPPPLATKPADKPPAPVRIDAQPAPVKLVTPPPPLPSPAPVPMPMPAAPIPRLPGLNEAPVLPPPPSWKATTNDGPLPANKIVVFSNFMPSSAKPEIRDLIDVTEPQKEAVPVGRTADGVPGTTARKTIGVNDGPITLGRTANFEIVTGQVQEYRKAFRLRYASIDQNDIFGGVVTLEGGIDLTQLRDGKHVRVRGVLIPPAEPNVGARYRVTAIEILD